jgi:hypothetical protein
MFTYDKEDPDPATNTTMQWREQWLAHWMMDSFCHLFLLFFTAAVRSLLFSPSCSVIISWFLLN